MLNPSVTGKRRNLAAPAASGAASLIGNVPGRTFYTGITVKF